MIRLVPPIGSPLFGSAAHPRAEAPLKAAYRQDDATGAPSALGKDVAWKHPRMDLTLKTFQLALDPIFAPVSGLLETAKWGARIPGRLVEMSLTGANLRRETHDRHLDLRPMEAAARAPDISTPNPENAP